MDQSASPQDPHKRWFFLVGDAEESENMCSTLVGLQYHFPQGSNRCIDLCMHFQQKDRLRCEFFRARVSDFLSSCENSRWGFTQKKIRFVRKKDSRKPFFPSPKKGSSQKRDVTITLDRTRRQARPCLLVVTRLIIEAGGSLTHRTVFCSTSRPTYRRWLS